MAFRVLRVVAFGTALAAACGNQCEDETSLLQGDRNKLLGKTVGTTPAASAPFRFSGDEPATLPKREVPGSLVEFALSIPDRYSDVAYDVEYHNFGEELVTLPMRRPQTFNLLTATCKTWLADMLVQLAEGGARRFGSAVFGSCNADGIDWRRSAAFAVFGFFFAGLVQLVLMVPEVSIMNMLCPNALASTNELMSAKLHNLPWQVKQFVMDNFLFAVMIYFPVFYTVKEVSIGSCSPISDALKKYKRNFLVDNLASMAFWIPGNCIAFAAPIYMRLPLEHSVSFIWTMYLSFKRGSSVSATELKHSSGSL